MATGKQFVHLHSHTEFSKLDGMSKIDELVAKVAEDGSPAVTCTDHGSMGGAIQLIQKARQYDIKPIVGIEAYMSRSMSERLGNRGDDKNIFHQLLIARNFEGYQNLMRLSSKAYRDGFYNKPRIDLDLLSQHSAGIIGTSTCLGSMVNQELLKGNREAALKLAADFRDVFDPGSYYIEIQNHGIPEQLQILDDQVWLAKKLGVGLVATNDNHYTDSCDADAHDTLLCIGTGSTKDNPDRMRFESDQHYVKSAMEMYDLFPERDFPGACSNTIEIADAVDLDLDISGKNHHLPTFPLPDKWSSPEEMLKDIVYKGAHEKYADGGSLPSHVVERVEYELNVIEKMGFSDYFLILSDVIHYMRSRGCLVGPGRGSAAGAIVSYCMGITSVDPLEHGLYFERFLNEGRKSMPDIDVDFDPEYRDLAFEYVADKYGADRVAYIGTYGMLKGRSSIKDAARVLSRPVEEGSNLAAKVPAGDITLDILMRPSSSGLDEGGKKLWKLADDLRKTYNKARRDGNENVTNIIDSAIDISGIMRNEGVHAAGVVITPENVMNYVPLRSTDKSDIMATQYSMVDVELTGVLKYDFLGLSNLTTIRRAVELIDKDMGKSIDVMDLPLDDPKVYELLRSGDLDGLFQVTSPGMMELIERMQPTGFEDISAAIALYRPGPMAMNSHFDYADRKNGRQKVTGIHPDFLETTKNTHGLVVYQEQVMQLAQHFAGYNPVEADNFRKAMGKKKAEVMEEQHEKFLDGVRSQNYPEELGRQLWDIVEPFAGYAFNKSHSVAYGKITYITAWLKAHYPAQFYAASIDCMGSDKAPGLVKAAKAHNIHVYAPDINKSGWYCTTSQDSIWLGMGGISHCGKPLVDGIERERILNGRYENIGDFLTRAVAVTKLNKKSATSLIHASLFDSLHSSRKALAENIEDMLADAKNLASYAEQDDAGDSLFDLDDDVGTALDDYDLNTEDYPPQERSALELNSIGFFVSGHPFDTLSKSIDNAKKVGIIPEEAVAPDDESVTVGAQGQQLYGIVTSVNNSTTRSKKEMCKFVIETGYDSAIECIVFGRSIDRSQVGSMAVVKGNVKMSYSAMTRDDKESDDLSETSIQVPLEDMEITCDEFTLVTVDKVLNAKPSRSKRAAKTSASTRPKKVSEKAEPESVKDRKQAPKKRKREPETTEVVDFAAARRQRRQGVDDHLDDKLNYDKLIIKINDLSDSEAIKRVLIASGPGDTVVMVSYKDTMIPMPGRANGGFHITDESLDELSSLTDVTYKVV